MLTTNSPLSLATLRMLHCRAHCSRPSMCIMYGCGTAHDTTLFARYCLVTPHQKPPEVGFGAPGGAPSPTPPKPTLGGLWRGVTWQYRANRVVPQAVPHPYMMHMLRRGQWVRPGSMRSDARVNYEFVVKGLVGERIVWRICLRLSPLGLTDLGYLDRGYLRVRTLSPCGYLVWCAERWSR